MSNSRSGASRGTRRGSGQALREGGHFNGMAFFRVADGKIVARWSVEDHLQMMRQLGFAPKQE